MAFRWRADDDPLIVVLGPSHELKNDVKAGPLLSKLSRSAHDLAVRKPVASSTMRVLSSARCTGVRLYTL